MKRLKKQTAKAISHLYAAIHPRRSPLIAAAARVLRAKAATKEAQRAIQTLHDSRHTHE